jgi:hypothetical protein
MIPENPAAQFTYSRNKFGWLMRDDKAAIPENDPNNVAYKLYLEWLELGNAPPPMPIIIKSVPQGAQRRDPDIPDIPDIDPSIYTYKRDERGTLLRIEDNSLIKEDETIPNNTPYTLYLQWLALGNEPPPIPPPLPEINIPTFEFSYFYDGTNILTRSDGVFVPENDPNNAVYRMYLRWLDEGNEPPPLNDITEPPEISPTYKSPYSPHSPTYGEPTPLPSPLPTPLQPVDPSLDVATKKYVNEQIAHAVAHALGHSHSHEEPKK